MSNYIVLTTFTDYYDFVIFKSLLDHSQVNYHSRSFCSLQLLPFLAQNENGFEILILDKDLEIANCCLDWYKYNNHLKIV